MGTMLARAASAGLPGATLRIVCLLWAAVVLEAASWWAWVCSIYHENSGSDGFWASMARNDKLAVTNKEQSIGASSVGRCCQHAGLRNSVFRCALSELFLRHVFIERFAGRAHVSPRSVLRRAGACRTGESSGHQLRFEQQSQRGFSPRGHHPQCHQGGTAAREGPECGTAHRVSAKGRASRSERGCSCPRFIAADVHPLARPGFRLLLWHPCCLEDLRPRDPRLRLDGPCSPCMTNPPACLECDVASLLHSMGVLSFLLCCDVSYVRVGTNAVPPACRASRPCVRIVSCVSCKGLS